MNPQCFDERKVFELVILGVNLIVAGGAKRVFLSTRENKQLRTPATLCYDRFFHSVAFWMILSHFSNPCGCSSSVILGQSLINFTAY